jgi:hypothetical protein
MSRPTSWRHTGRVQVQHYRSLASALDAGEWSASRPDRFGQGKEPQYPLNRMLDESRSRSARFREGDKSLAPTEIRTRHRSRGSLLTILTTFFRPQRHVEWYEYMDVVPEILLCLPDFTMWHTAFRNLNLTHQFRGNLSLKCIACIVTFSHLFITQFTHLRTYNKCRYAYDRAVPWLRPLAASLPPRRPGFDPGSVRVGFLLDKEALGQVFPRVLRFSPVNFIPPVLHY